MTPERWARVTELFDAACQQPPRAREAWLEASGDDAELRAEVRAMLEAYDTDPAISSSRSGRRCPRSTWRCRRAHRPPPGRVASRAPDRPRRHGRRLRGAARRPRVRASAPPIKILPAWSSRRSLSERFRMERRVLAGARPSGHRPADRLGDDRDDGVALLRHGAGGRRRPIDGVVPRTRSLHADAGGCALVEQICDAVAYAHHRHLVVHRDLKPANILVTLDGHAQAARLRHRDPA